jgi:predicted RNA-binding Zn-ribbon protein involved in translation (DUF1610 family)
MNHHEFIHNIPSEPFICVSCGKEIESLEYGGRHRNHCPHCLSSCHIDIVPGDRKSTCLGTMKPIGIHVQKNGEWSLIHRCSKCGTIKINRTAHDDNELLLLTIAAEPMMSLPFPAKKIISTLQKLSVEKGS